MDVRNLCNELAPAMSTRAEVVELGMLLVRSYIYIHDIVPSDDRVSGF